MRDSPNDSVPPQQNTAHIATALTSSGTARMQVHLGTASAQPICASATPKPRYGLPNLGHETIRNNGFIALMVQEAMEMSRKLGSDNALIARIGMRLPHPEPYAGESDIEIFEVFVAGLLRWMSMNLLLGSSNTHALVQLRYLGTCLKGTAPEWYSHEVEHCSQSTCRWTLESTPVGLQNQFLHPLTYTAICR